MARRCSTSSLKRHLILFILVLTNRENNAESSKTLTTATEQGFRINKFELVNTSTTEISIVSSIPVSGHPILLVNATSTVTLMCTFEGNPKLQFRIRHKETNKIYPDSPTLQQASGNYTISVIHAFSCEDSGEYICENAKVSCNNSCKRIILVTPCKPRLLNKEIGYENSTLNVNVLLMSYPPVNSAQVFVKGEQINDRNWFSNIQHLSFVKMSLNLSKFNMAGEIILELCNPEGCLDVFQTINNRAIESSSSESFTNNFPVIIGIVSTALFLIIVFVILCVVIFINHYIRAVKIDDNYYATMLDTSNGRNTASGYTNVIQPDTGNPTCNASSYNTVVQPDISSRTCAASGYTTVIQPDTRNRTCTASGYTTVIHPDARNRTCTASGYTTMIQPDTINRTSTASGYTTVIQPDTSNRICIASDTSDERYETVIVP